MGQKILKVKKLSVNSGIFSAAMANRPDAQKIHYLFALRNLKDHWNLDTRRAYFMALNEARTKSGGASYQGFLNNIEKGDKVTIKFGRADKVRHIDGEVVGVAVFHEEIDALGRELALAGFEQAEHDVAALGLERRIHDLIGLLVIGNGGLLGHGQLVGTQVVLQVVDPPRSPHVGVLPLVAQRTEKLAARFRARRGIDAEPKTLGMQVTR